MYWILKEKHFNTKTTGKHLEELHVVLSQRGRMLLICYLVLSYCFLI